MKEFLSFVRRLLVSLRFSVGRYWGTGDECIFGSLFMGDGV